MEPNIRILPCSTGKDAFTRIGPDLEGDKVEFATASKDCTLEEALKEADVFIGLSVGNVLTKDMVKSMAKRPIVFAMANPDPEIKYEDALDARKM